MAHQHIKAISCQKKQDDILDIIRVHLLVCNVKLVDNIEIRFINKTFIHNFLSNSVNR